MRILITGGSGLLGQYLNIELSRDFSILTCYNENVGNCGSYKNHRLDLTNLASLRSLVQSYRPDVVVHVAAMASPMLPVGMTRAYVYKVNVSATRELAKAASETGARIIYTSTDLVYAGYRGTMLTESAKLVPISLYAETKLLGEEKVVANCENHVILRTSLMYGIGLNHTQSHFNFMLKELKTGNSVKLFTDQIRTPLSYSNAASMISKIIKKPNIQGIYNFGGRDKLSRYEMGNVVCRLGGYNTNLLIPTSCKEIPGYPAVEDVSLDSSKLAAKGISASSFEEEVKSILTQFV